MAIETRGLGRGLGALLGAEIRASPSRGGGTLPISMMQSGTFQPRRAVHRELLEELAASIKANGIIQPIVVRPLPAGTTSEAKYEIVAGERRWQAAKLAGLKDIPTIVRALSDAQAVALALIENIQREELTSAEEARALQRLVTEFSLTHAQVADSVGRSRAAVSNLIRLLELPSEVIELIDSKTVSMGHARALLGLEDDSERVRLGRTVADRGLSVRDTERLVRESLTGARPGPAAGRSAGFVKSEVLRTPFLRLQMQQKAPGIGRLILEFKDAATRDEVIQAIRSIANHT